MLLLMAAASGVDGSGCNRQKTCGLLQSQQSMQPKCPSPAPVASVNRFNTQGLKPEGLHCRVLACLAVMLVLQCQWGLQTGGEPQLIHSSLPDSSRHLLGAEVPEVLAATAQNRPDWVRYPTCLGP